MRSRELPPRFHSYIARRRIRMFAATSLGMCLLVGSATALATNAASETRAAIARSSAPARAQLAAASSVDWLDTLGDRLFDIVCPLFNGCPPPEFAESENVATAPQLPRLPRPEPHAATTAISAEREQPLQESIQQTVINQPVIERVTETVRTVSGITDAMLTERLAALSADFATRLSVVSTNGVRQAEIIFDSIGDTGGGGGAASAVIDAVSAVIGDLVSSNVTATNATTTNLAVTGTATIGNGTGVLQTTSGAVATIANGSNGQVLKIIGGAPQWSADLQGSGGGDSAWATTSDDLAIVSADPSDVVVIGNNATTTGGTILEVAGASLVRGALTAYDTVTAPRFTATSSIASQLPYASTTALSVSGTGSFATASTSALIVSGAPNGLLKTSPTGAVSVAMPGTDYVAAVSGDWTGTLDGQEGAFYLASAFSTTSADTWKSNRNFFSTSSADHYVSVTNFFATTSADAWKDTRNFFSTTSVDYWETQQTARNTDDLTNNSIEDLSDVAAMTENFGDLFAWNGAAWADVATSTLAIALSDTTGTLGATRGGTGLSSVAAAGILVGNYAGTGWQQLATSTLGLLTTHVSEGSNLYYLDSRVQTYLDAIDKGFFFSTTSAAYFASQNQGASFSTTSATHFVHSSTTIPKTYTSNIFTGSNTFASLTLGSFNGPLHASEGMLSATTSIGVLYGGTGLTALATGYIPFGAGSSAFATSSSLFFDSGTGRLGIGTTSPYAKLSVVGPVVADYFHATSTGATSTFAGGLVAGANGALRVNANAPQDSLLVKANGQVSVGYAGGVDQYRQFYVNLVDTSSTGDTTAHAAIETRLDYRPPVDSNGHPDGVYGTLWYNSPVNFTGTGAAVRGNAYTIAQTGDASVNVTNLVGVYGRARHESAGLVTNAISFFADGAQNGSATGTIALGAGLWVDSQTAATNNYGVYFENEPNAGSLAAANNINLSYKTIGAGVHTFSTGGSERMRVASDGNVGIGTTSPYAKLSVVGPVVAEYIQATSTTASTFGGSVNVGGSGSKYVGFTSGQNAFVLDASAGTGLTSTANIHINIDSNNDETTRYFAVANNNSTLGSGTELFRVQENGNVGIGTTTPGYKLQVSDATSAFNSDGGNIVLSNSIDPLKRLGFGIDTSLGSNGSGWVQAVKSGTGFLPLLLNPNSGNVGIATTSPWRTLSVSGTVGFAGLTGSTGAGSLCLSSTNQVVYNSASDACLSSTRATKHDINPLALEALEQVLALQPVSFIYNEGDGRTRYGFIAEDTAAVDAHLATYDASSTISGIDDRSIIAVLVAAVKELANKISETAHLVIDAITARVGNFGRVNTDQLCVDDICVTRDQFAEVFGSSKTTAAGTSNSGVASGDTSGQSAVSFDTDTASTSTASETAPTTSTASSTPAAANDNDPVVDAPTDETPPGIQLVDEAPAEVPEPDAELVPANDNSPVEQLPATGTE